MRNKDSGYEAARKSMQRLILAVACDEYICSIFDLHKRIKKLKDKERARRKKNLPPIDEAVDRFWDLFYPKRPELIQFAAAQSDYFPEGFMSQFVEKLERARWTRLKDPHYEIASKIMGCLISATCPKVLLDLDDNHFAIFESAEKEIETMQIREESQKRREEAQVRREEKDRKDRERNQHEKEARLARNKAVQTNKDRATLENLKNRLRM